MYSYRQNVSIKDDLVIILIYHFIVWFRRILSAMMYKPLFHVVMLCSSHSTYHSELVVVIIYLFSLPELVSLMMLSERYN